MLQAGFRPRPLIGDLPGFLFLRPNMAQRVGSGGIVAEIILRSRQNDIGFFIGGIDLDGLGGFRGGAGELFLHQARRLLPAAAASANFGSR